MEDEDVPPSPEEAKRWEILLFSRYKLRIPVDMDSDKTVVSLLKRQLSKHCTRFENILETETKKGESAGTRIERTKLGNRTEPVERQEPVQEQPNTITAEGHSDAL